jgi:hypothetical protein
MEPGTHANPKSRQHNACHVLLAGDVPPARVKTVLWNSSASAIVPILIDYRRDAGYSFQQRRRTPSTGRRLAFGACSASTRWCLYIRQCPSRVERKPGRVDSWRVVFTLHYSGNQLDSGHLLPPSRCALAQGRVERPHTSPQTRNEPLPAMVAVRSGIDRGSRTMNRCTLLVAVTVYVVTEISTITDGFASKWAVSYASETSDTGVQNGPPR